MNLEDTVRNVVKDFMKNDTLFTALDVSNVVKQTLPSTRHKEVRNIVRGLFVSDIESQNWARTPITVNLSDGSTADALLYHPLSDSWDLDNKYDSQKRGQVPFKHIQVVQAAIAQSQAPIPAPTVVVPTSVAPDARTIWDQLFKSKPSLFPIK